MIDPVDRCCTFSRKAGNDERHGRTQIGCHHRRTLQPLGSGDMRHVAVKGDTRTQPRQLLHMHEAIFEDGLADA